MTFFEKLKLLVRDTSLRKRLIFLLGALVVYRVFANIPIPGVDTASLETFLSDNAFFGLLNIFSGGGLSGLSIIMLGVAPYITASIIMQLLTIVFPRLKELYQEEGEAGRRKFAQYSRLLSVPLAIVQGFGFLTLLERNGVVLNLGGIDLVTNLIVITGGALLLMWLGELITEFGIGNGVSVLIFAGIVAQIPGTIRQLTFTFTPEQIPVYLAFAAAALLIIFGVVVVTEAERPIPVTYAKRVRGNRVYGGVSTYLPLRVNQAGVIPIIFALSILLFPQMIGNFLATFGGAFATTIAGWIAAFAQNTALFSMFYFALVFLFTYFYTAITFDPDTIAKNLQRNGAFVPGVRPGASTAAHLGRVLTRLTLVGAVFLAVIAVLPLIAQTITGNAALAIGGTGLLIVVSVVIDLIKKTEGQLSMREY